MGDHRPKSTEIGSVLAVLRKHKGKRKFAARELGITTRHIRRLLKRAKKEAAQDDKTAFVLPHAPRIGAEGGRKWVMKSSKDNKFRFAAMGDLHAASKYCRWDVRTDLMKRAEDFGAQAILDTGNWIDGTKPFNIHDLDAIGLEMQCQLLAKLYPKCGIPTYAITGDDHEGWYVRSEGIDVGRYCESIMRNAGHDWTNLGYIEADIVLENANTKKSSILRLMHPGGGSAYALSYKPQKIIESLEGGEKPAIILIGHYHKIDFGVVRNCWYIQTGTQQDQTPFLRSRQIQAHVGGFLIECEQDPNTGAIIAFTPEARLYYNREYYVQSGMGNERWSRTGAVKPVPRATK